MSMAKRHIIVIYVGTQAYEETKTRMQSSSQYSQTSSAMDEEYDSFDGDAV